MENEWTVLSAGTWTTTGQPAHTKAIEAAAKIGLDIKSHRTRVVDSALLHAADLIVAMQNGHKEALEAEFPVVRGHVVLLGSLANNPENEIADPATDNFSQPEETAHLINTSIVKAFLRLVQFADDLHNKQESKSP